MAEEHRCTCCGELIPAARLRALPGTTTCVRCATVPKKKRSDLRGEAFIQHTGGLHEKYLHEEDAEMDRKDDTTGTEEPEEET
jgi:hypothetical protein